MGLKIRVAVLCIAALFGSVAFAAPDEQRIAALISAGKIEQARQELKASNPTQLDLRFFEARITKGAGQLDQAIALFRGILSTEPRYLNARRELAHTLFLARQYDSAEFHFKELIRIDPQPRLVEQYRQFLRVIGDNQPLSVSFFGAVLPSTNINRGTTNAFFDTDLGRFVIDESSQAESGIGVEAGLNGVARFGVDQNSRFLMNWSVATRIYENPEFNTVTGFLRPAYEYAFAEGRWRVGPYARYSWHDSDQSNYAVGGQATLVHRLTPSIAAEVSSRYELRTFRDQEFRDGGFASATVTLRKQLDPSFSISGGVSVDRDAPETAHLRYRGVRLSAGALKRWRGGFDTRVNAEYAKRMYDNDFPFLSETRQDTFWSASFSVLNSQLEFWGISPQLNCSYLATASNVALFEFDSAECRIGFSREF